MSASPGDPAAAASTPRTRGKAKATAAAAPPAGSNTNRKQQRAESQLRRRRSVTGDTVAAAADTDGYAPVEVEIQQSGAEAQAAGSHSAAADAEDDGLGLAVVDNSPSPAPAEDDAFVAPRGEEQRVKSIGRKLLSAAGLVLLLFCGVILGATLSWVAMGGTVSGAASFVSASVNQLLLSTSSGDSLVPVLTPSTWDTGLDQGEDDDKLNGPPESSGPKCRDPPFNNPFNRLPNPCNHTKFVAPLPQPRIYPPCFWDADGQPHYGASMRQIKQWLGLFDRFGEKLYTVIWAYGADCREAWRETLPIFLAAARAANRTLIVNSPEAVEAAGAGHSWPGPMFETRSNEPIFVLWKTELPRRHIFERELNDTRVQLDCSLFAPNCTPEVRNVVHLHGGHTLPHYDGHPTAWFTQHTPIKLEHVDRVRRDGSTGTFYLGRDYLYALDQEAATLWYHDHAMGITRLDVYSGLAGFVAHRDERERRLQQSGVLPSGQFEMFLALSDRWFHLNGSEAGQLDYNRFGENEVYANYSFVNGMAWPVADVQPTRYRLRLLNSCSTRTLRLHFAVDHPDEWRTDSMGSYDDYGGADERERRARFGSFDPDKPRQLVPFHMVASDGGLLVQAAPTYRWWHMLAERYELVIDFAPYAGRNITLHNSGPREMGAPWVCPPHCAPSFNTGPDRFMRFRVKDKLDDDSDGGDKRHDQDAYGTWGVTAEAAEAAAKGKGDGHGLSDASTTASTPVQASSSTDSSSSANDRNSATARTVSGRTTRVRASSVRPTPSPYTPSLFNSPTSPRTSPFPSTFRPRILTGAVDRVRQIVLVEVEDEEMRVLMANRLGLRILQPGEELDGLDGTDERDGVQAAAAAAEAEGPGAPLSSEHAPLELHTARTIVRDGVTITLAEDGAEQPAGRGHHSLYLLTVNDNRFRNGLPFNSETTEVLEACTTERWEIINLTNDTHAIHIHLIEFELIGRANYSLFRFGREPVLRMGTIRPPQPYELGPKDTVRVDPGVAVYVQGFYDRPGRFVFHCHMLEHEDLEMMHNQEIMPSECACISSPLLREDPIIPARNLPPPFNLPEHRDPKEDKWYAQQRHRPHRNQDRGSYTALGEPSGLLTEEEAALAADNSPLVVDEHMLMLPIEPAPTATDAAVGSESTVAVKAASASLLSLHDLLLTPGGTHAWKVPYQPHLFPKPPLKPPPLEEVEEELEVEEEDPAELRPDRFIVNLDLAIRERLLKVLDGDVGNRLSGTFCSGFGGAPTFEATEEAEEADPQRRIELAIQEIRQLQRDEVRPVNADRAETAITTGPPLSAVIIVDPDGPKHID